MRECVWILLYSCHTMDPAQGESGGGRSLTSKIKARVTNQHLGSKVKSIKNRLPGLKKRDGGDEHGYEENSSEYDDSPHNSPRGPGPETRYNVGESTPFSTLRTNPASSDPNINASQNRDHDTRSSYPDSTGYGIPVHNNPSEYDAKSRNHVPMATTTRPASVSTDTPSSNMTPSTGHLKPLHNNPLHNAETRNYVPGVPPTRPAPLSTDIPRSNLAPPTDSPRSNLAPTTVDKLKNLGVNEKSPRDISYRSDLSSQPQAKYSPPLSYPDSMVESTQKGYNDVSRPSATADSSSLPNRANKGILEKMTESVAGAAAVVGDKLGYYREEDLIPRDPNAPGIMQKTKMALGLDKPTDPNAPSVLTKAKSALGFDKPRDPNAVTLLNKSKATLGLDKPRDPNAPPLTQKAKIYMNTASQKTREYSSTAADRAAFAKDRLAAHTTPTHHDKELSEQVTQTLSTLPGTFKEKILPVLGLVNGGNKTNSPRNYQSIPIVDRVRGAASSLFAAAPKETGEHLQHTFPAHSDFGRPNAVTPRSDHEQPAAGVYQNYGDGVNEQQKMPVSSAPVYPGVNS